ncbi:hypothetical protein P0O24_12130 [Methanotrichaceae archaeon M04Ac]|jgi:hypothetical protein|uniref:PspA-associated domain-containing protein n=1 Tax=Candidatus Methanocrinis alkalitolerans TaxID=3033395 RepID=A0ABT5XIK9_9EURY|nr:hypothetical protein [Candidatus Methanocrinis alkalitolerans]MCR3884371.1 hypothetical protein [Methanothrix sp.]MDF0594327.1 hypothetical protein [Candidatus Methanocrinis alkalitolerans]
MIIRIMGEGQYRVSSALLDDLNLIDDRIVEDVAKEDEAGYREDLSRLIQAIKEKGEPIRSEEILESDVIVPPEDLTLEEAERVFRGSGLIPM